MDEKSTAQFRLALAESRRSTLAGLKGALKKLLPKPKEFYDFADRISLENLKKIDSEEDAIKLMTDLRSALIKWGNLVETFFEDRN